MAQYKVPQDVEAEDILIGPFSFRQFIYLVIAAGMIALMVGLFQIFPLLAIIPLPIILFFGALALPLKKDQPMETYLAAVASYYLKPRRRIWLPGQREHSIQITAPKKVEGPRTRDISGEEASHRLSFLADIVDTEGRSIKANTNISEGFLAENSNAQDIFEPTNTNNLNSMINRNDYTHRAAVIDNMRTAINEVNHPTPPAVAHAFTNPTPPPQPVTPPVAPVTNPAAAAAPSVPDSIQTPTITKPQTPPKPPKPSIIELANNSDFSVQTIQKEANRINKKDNEVYISLH